MYRPRWSSEILTELEFCETEKLIKRGEQPDAAAARAHRLIDLPDSDDEHVAAAAVVGGAGAIVTDNLKDFPIANVPAHVKVLSPAEFAADTVAVSPDVALRALQTMASRYSAPRLTTEDILDRLVQRYVMIEAVEPIRAVT
jgi:hypothetical protein